jgi:hypothetical protein
MTGTIPRKSQRSGPHPIPQLAWPLKKGFLPGRLKALEGRLSQRVPRGRRAGFERAAALVFLRFSARTLAAARHRLNSTWASFDQGPEQRQAVVEMRISDVNEVEHIEAALASFHLTVSRLRQS